jgi:hypothetical protein
LPALALAADIEKLDRSDALDDDAEGRAGFDRLQLLVIADQDELRPGFLDGLEKAIHLLGADHAGLVDDEDVAALEQVFAPGPAPLPAMQGSAFDARFLGEPLACLARERAAEDAPAIA